MRLQLAEQRGALARAVRQDLRGQAAVVFVDHRLRHLAEEGEGMDVAVHPGLRRRRRMVKSGNCWKFRWPGESAGRLKAWCVIDQPALQAPAPGPDRDLDPVLLHIGAGGEEQPACGTVPGFQSSRRS
jgi:hypothetical protein